MKKPSKELSGFGYVLYLILGFCMAFMPIWFLPIHGIWMIAAVAVILFVPFAGGILNFALWIISFPAVLGGTQDVFAIAYYVVFAVYIIFNIIPLVLSLISSISKK